MELPKMTLRDYFAAHAQITVEDAIRTLPEHWKRTESNGDEVHAQLADLRYRYADAMLNEKEDTEGAR